MEFLLSTMVFGPIPMHDTFGQRCLSSLLAAGDPPRSALLKKSRLRRWPRNRSNTTRIPNNFFSFDYTHRIRSIRCDLFADIFRFAARRDQTWVAHKD